MILRAESPLRDARAVLFDLDGTLIDAVESHYRVFTRVLDEFRIRFDEETFRRHYSPNWYDFYARMGLPQDRWPEADRLWLRFYAEEAPERRDGADDALAAVRASGLEDVEMGKAAGVTTLAVVGGFSPREALERTAPRGLLESLRDLVRLL